MHANFDSFSISNKKFNEYQREINENRNKISNMIFKVLKIIE